MDLCSRKIIGYAYGTSMTTELAVKAVENACLSVRDTKGIILHSVEASIRVRHLKTAWSGKKSCIPLAVREIYTIMPALNPSILY